MCDAVSELDFGTPVTHVYNPLCYARAAHELYLERFGSARKEIVLVGMNPGPFGMGQTGVPFGDVAMVRDWMGIRAPVAAPRDQHPKRPILGFDCRRSEVSGSRLWGWARARYQTPERFFDRFFVLNYCPLIFLESSGRNRTPDKLPAAEKRPLLEVCDNGLLQALSILNPRWVVGVGTWAARRAKGVIHSDRVRVGSMLHPSPASPKANRGWAEQAEKDLLDLGIQL